MLRAWIRRHLGQTRGAKLSARNRSALIWPTWFAVDLPPNPSSSYLDHLRNVVKWHQRIGTRDVLFFVGPDSTSTLVIQALEQTWHQGARTWLAVGPSSCSAAFLKEALRAGVSGITVAWTAAVSGLIEVVEQLATLHLQARNVPLSLTLNVCNLALENSGLVQRARDSGISLWLDVPTSSALQETALTEMGLVRARIQEDDWTSYWSLIVSRRSGLWLPYSGWFVGPNWDVRLDPAAPPVGRLDHKRVQSSWLSPSAQAQWRAAGEAAANGMSLGWRLDISSRSNPTLEQLDVMDGVARTVTVVVPTYHRRPDQIARTIAALQHQNYPAALMEIMVVDDGNEDDVVAAALSRLPKGDERTPRTTSLRIAHSGAAEARNRGIRATRSELVAFTDDDCEPEPNWLREMVATFNEPGVGGVGGLTLPRHDGRSNWIVRFIDQRRALRRFWVDKDSRHVDILPTANAAYRREALEKVGGFSDMFQVAGLSYGGEDRHLTWQILEAGYTTRVNLQARVWHEHRQNLRQLIEQGYRYGCGCYLHCRLSRQPYDYEPRLSTLWAVIREYWLPYPRWVVRYYQEGARGIDALTFPWLDGARRLASAIGSIRTDRRLVRLDLVDPSEPVRP